MKTILKKELKSYSHGTFAYVAAALLLLLSGALIVLFNLGMGSSNLLNAEGALSLSFVIIAPLLSAFALPKERQAGTEALLFSLPIRTRSIVLGKFLAVLLLFLLPLAPAVVLSLSFSAFGKASAAYALNVWLGLWIEGISLIALCFFLSSLCRRPLTAFGAGLAATLGLYLLWSFGSSLPGSAPFSLCVSAFLILGLSYALWRASDKIVLAVAVGGGALILTLLLFWIDQSLFVSLPSALSQYINPFSFTGGFSYGRMDLILLLSAALFVALFLFLTVLSVKRRRILQAEAPTEESEKKLSLGSSLKARFATVGTLAAALVLTLTVILNTLLPLLPQSIFKPDLAMSESFELSDTTKNELSTLDRDVTVYFPVAGGQAYADGELYSFLRSYEELSPHVQVKVIDTNADDGFLASHGLDAESADGSIVVESDKRHRTLTSDLLYYYQNATFGYDRLSVSDYLTQCAYIESYYGEEYLYEFVASSTAYFDGEQVLTNAIRFASAETVPTAYILIASTAMEFDQTLRSSLELDGYVFHEIASMSELGDDCDLLILNSPTRDLTQADAEALSSYLANGGRLLLSTAYTAGVLPNLEGVLSTYGLSFGEAGQLVCEGNSSYAYSKEGVRYLFYAHVAPHALGEGFKENFFVPLAHPINLSEREGVTVTPWLYTSDEGYLLDPKAEAPSEDEESAEENAPAYATYTVGAIAEAGETVILWFSSPDAIASTGDAFSNGGNLTLVKQALSRLTGHTSLSVPASPFDLQEITVPTDTLLLLSLLSVILLPAVTVAWGAIRCYLRKKR